MRHALFLRLFFLIASSSCAGVASANADEKAADVVSVAEPKAAEKSEVLIEKPTLTPTAPEASTPLERVAQSHLERILETQELSQSLDHFKKIQKFSKWIGNENLKNWARLYLASVLVKSSSDANEVFWVKYAVNHLVRVPEDFNGLTPQTRNWLTTVVQTALRNLAQRHLAEGQYEKAEELLATLENWTLGLPPGNQPEVATDWIGFNLIPMSGQELDAQKFVDSWLANPKTDTAALLSEIKSTLETPSKKAGRSIASVPITEDELEQDRAIEANALGKALKLLGSSARDTVGLVYFTTDKAINILAMKGSAKFSTSVAIDSLSLRAKVSQYLRGLQANHISVESGEMLYKLLIAPIHQKLVEWGAKQIVVSVDDSLSFLPFAALPDLDAQTVNGRHPYLVERYKFAVFAATKDVRQLRPTDLKRNQLVALGVADHPRGLPPLPGVRKELDGIFLDGWISGKYYLDEEFTIERLREATSFPVTHIATHFNLGSNFTQSYLSMGDGRQLSMKDLMSDPLLSFDKTQLLTLSACYTGVDVSGRPVKSFGAIAHLRGARSVIATLWKLPDAHAAAVSRLLYKTNAMPGLSVAEVLQETQRQAISQDIPPSAWASFVLFGAWL